MVQQQCKDQTAVEDGAKVLMEVQDQLSQVCEWDRGPTILRFLNLKND